MTRSRLVVTSSLSLVVLVAAVAAGLLVLQPAAAAVGPLPPEALALPGDAPFLMGLDVRKLVASPFYQKQVGGSAQARLDAFREIQERTGLDPERDVEAIVFAGATGAGPRRGVALVLGSFDEVKLTGAIERRPGVSSAKHQGVSVFSYAEAGATRAMAILDQHSIVLGEEHLVRATIENRGAGKAGLTSNAAQVARLKRVRPGATFWLVGDASVLRHLPKTLPAPGLGGSGGSLALPALEQVVVSGDFDPQIAVDVVGDTADEAGARNLADILRGFIAFFSMQAAQRPELQGLGSAFNVAQTGNQVSVAVRLSPELVDALQKSGRPTPPAESPETR